MADSHCRRAEAHCRRPVVPLSGWSQGCGTVAGLSYCRRADTIMLLQGWVSSQISCSGCSGDAPGCSRDASLLQLLLLRVLLLQCYE